MKLHEVILPTIDSEDWKTFVEQLVGALKERDKSDVSSIIGMVASAQPVSRARVWSSLDDGGFADFFASAVKRECLSPEVLARACIFWFLKYRTEEVDFLHDRHDYDRENDQVANDFDRAIFDEFASKLTHDWERASACFALSKVGFDHWREPAKELFKSMREAANVADPSEFETNEALESETLFLSRFRVIDRVIVDLAVATGMGQFGSLTRDELFEVVSDLILLNKNKHFSWYHKGFFEGYISGLGNPADKSQHENDENHAYYLKGWCYGALRRSGNNLATRAKHIFADLQPSQRQILTDHFDLLPESIFNAVCALMLKDNDLTGAAGFIDDYPSIGGLIAFSDVPIQVFEELDEGDLLSVTKSIEVCETKLRQKLKQSGVALPPPPNHLSLLVLRHHLQKERFQQVIDRSSKLIQHRDSEVEDGSDSTDQGQVPFDDANFCHDFAQLRIAAHHALSTRDFGNASELKSFAGRIEPLLPKCEDQISNASPVGYFVKGVYWLISGYQDQVEELKAFCEEFEGVLDAFAPQMKLTKEWQQWALCICDLLRLRLPPADVPLADSRIQRICEFLTHDLKSQSRKSLVMKFGLSEAICHFDAPVESVKRLISLIDKRELFQSQAMELLEGHPQFIRLVLENESCLYQITPAAASKLLLQSVQLIDDAPGRMLPADIERLIDLLESFVLERPSFASDLAQAIEKYPSVLQGIGGDEESEKEFVCKLNTLAENHDRSWILTVDLLRNAINKMQSGLGDSSKLQHRMTCESLVDRLKAHPSWSTNAQEITSMVDRINSSRQNQLRQEDAIDVQILFVGGDDQSIGKLMAGVKQRVKEKFPRVTVKHVCPGFSSHYEANLAKCEKFIPTIDAVVIHPHMRTTFGRRLRKIINNHNAIWRACRPHEGVQAISESIISTIHVLNS